MIIGIPGRLQSVQAAAFARNPPAEFVGMRKKLMNFAMLPPDIPTLCESSRGLFPR